jgi:hypothetical protein
MKSWSYKQLTEHTEKLIKQHMDDARNVPPRQNNDEFERWLFRSWGRGAFMAWDRLTTGWQKDFDYERLHALAEFEMDVLIQDGHVYTKPKPNCEKCRGIGSYIEGDEYKNCECCT